ncbi:MAG: undecaprenyl-phosphate galactose phosphotransferase [uncultured bacterium]|nr:MAG: undecaprenyl-phosphate galactose phosphotransferase [uncultured bacterium]HBH18528.1 hypothetical protein [Cyanobacteria bacterium UBA9579]
MSQIYLSDLEIVDNSLKSLNSTKRCYLIVKRIADIIFSSIILILTSPILAFLTLCIRLESKGPVLFTQKRVGKDGKIIELYKLRTMYTEVKDSGGGINTVDNDPRITKIGKMIRSCSLDEFPQFINILKGEMSYIGPRPISLDEHNFVLKCLENENEPIPQGLIHMVQPGITGWALLHGREKISYEDRFRLNAEYENNFSLWFDLKIFFLTFKKYFFTNFMVFILFLATLLVFISVILK